MTNAAAVVVPVLFATARAKKPGTGHGNAAPLYADGEFADRNVTYYGTCKVLLPAGRETGSKEAGLPQEVKEESWSVKDMKVLVFIHGYNNSFNDAIQAAARVKNDAKWGGPVVAFSWPSFGFVANYNADEDNQKLSIAYFIDFLKAIKVLLVSFYLRNSFPLLDNSNPSQSVSRLHFYSHLGMGLIRYLTLNVRVST